MQCRRRGSRVRVLHVVDSLGIGGIERNLVDLVARTGGEFEHEICCIRRAGALAAGLEALGARIHSLGARSGRTLSLVAQVMRLCRARSPDVVHARNWGTIEAVFAARIARVPLVVYGEHGPRAWSGLRRSVGRRMVAAAADVVVAVSNALRDYLFTRVKVPADRITVIRNGVDTERFRPRADREGLRRDRGLAPDTLLIGGVGRLDPIKNYARLVDAFAEVAKRDPKTRLVLVGDGPERERLQGEIDSRSLASRAWITGLRDDVADWLAAMDVFAHVSFAEGLSNAILQAMAVGLPVVATAVAANREAVVGGVSGRLVDPHATADVAAALSCYGSDPAARALHGAAGRRRVEAEFPLQRMVDGYRSLYARVAAMGA